MTDELNSRSEMRRITVQNSHKLIDKLVEENGKLRKENSQLIEERNSTAKSFLVAREEIAALQSELLRVSLGKE